MHISRSGRVPTLLFASAALATAALVPSLTAQAHEQGNTEACTPGYWKNHTDNWLENPNFVVPSTKKLSSEFGSLTTTFPQYADDTFLDALQYKGGSGADGAARNLLRHAVAAWLNAAFDDDAGHLQYPLARPGSTEFYPDFDGIVPEVNAALESGDRDTMLALKDFFDGIANDLACPL